MISVLCRKYKFDLNESRNVKELKAFYFILLSLADEPSKMTIAEKNKNKKACNKHTISWQQAQRPSINVMATQLNMCFCAPAAQAIS